MKSLFYYKKYNAFQKELSQQEFENEIKDLEQELAKI